MKKLSPSLGLLIITLLIVLIPSRLLAYETGRTVIKEGTVTEDLYVAGGMVRVFAEAEGDVVAAGGSVTIGQLVKGDVIAAGGSVNVRARVLDDIRAAGGTVTIEGEVGGDAIAAGGTVSLAPETRIHGRAWLAGGHIEVAGSIGKELKAVGGTITIAGNVQGDVELVAQEIEILPTARIQGNLTYRSPQEAKVDPSAHIEGKVSYTETEMGYPPVQRGTFKVLFFLSLMVAGTVLFLLFPNFTVSAARNIGGDPWKSLGLGLALLVTTPFVVVLLMATVLGVPLALMLFAIYATSLLAGFLIAVIFLGEMEVRFLHRGPELSRSWRILSIILALVVLWLIQLIPVIGCVVLFIALLFGLGALGLQAYRTYSIAHS